MFDCDKSENFEICDQDGNCRTPNEFMETEGLVAAQPANNIERAYEVKESVDEPEGDDQQGDNLGKVSINKLDDGNNGDNGLLYAPCSMACCTPQYPPPFKTGCDKEICGNKDKYVPTNYKCNNAWQNTGCLCMTKEQSDFLASRGGNN
jgi:hypothetical protein